MRLSSFFIVLVILTSCSAEKRLARLLEKHPQPIDTVEVMRDTTVYVELPGDTVKEQVNVFLPGIPIDLPDTSITAETDFARAKAGLVQNTLWLELIQTDTLIEVVIDSVTVERIVTQTVVKEIPTEKKFWKHGFLVLAGLILLLASLWFLLRRR